MEHSFSPEQLRRVLGSSEGRQLLALLAMLPIALYNGERGFSGKALQYGFYAFYPVHILILSVLAQYVF